MEGKYLSENYLQKKNTTGTTQLIQSYGFREKCAKMLRNANWKTGFSKLHDIQRKNQRKRPLFDVVISSSHFFPCAVSSVILDGT